MFTIESELWEDFVCEQCGRVHEACICHLTEEEEK